MKNFLSIFLALMAPIYLWAHDFEVNGIYYNHLEGNNVEVTFKGSNHNEFFDYYVGAVTIPETVTYNDSTYSVTSIGDEAFLYCSSLTSVTIPDGVTSIGEWAFEKCSALTSITIPNCVTSIRDDAFYDCSSLTSIVWNAKNCANYDHPFRGCKNITSFVIGETVEHIPANLCYGMNSLQSITIPNSITSIGSGAFEDCSSLTSVEWNAKNCQDISSSLMSSNPIFSNIITEFIFGDSVEHIPGKLCYRLDKLTSVTIGNSVMSIGSYAFSYCSSLTSITIPNSVTSIGNNTFAGCTSLTAINIPNSITSIGNAAFAECSSLTSPVYNAHCFAYLPPSFEGAYIIPEGIKQITGCAFYNCISLTSITIPNSITSIGDWAFAYCSFLDSITIPNSVTSIGDEAFYLCTSLDSITIPNSVTSMGEGAFAFCKNLSYIVWNQKHCHGYWTDATIYNIFFGCENVTSVVFGDNVIEIPKYFCNQMQKLSSITISNSVTSIGFAAFAYCSSLTSITIPSSITSMEDYAFYGCSCLTAVICEAVEVPILGLEVFYNMPLSEATLYVPAQSLDDYKAAEQWKEFGTILPIEETSTGVENTYNPSSTAVTNKLIRDGQLIIVRGGKSYSVTGQEL